MCKTFIALVKVASFLREFDVLFIPLRNASEPSTLSHVCCGALRWSTTTRQYYHLNGGAHRAAVTSPVCSAQAVMFTFHLRWSSSNEIKFTPANSRWKPLSFRKVCCSVPFSFWSLQCRTEDLIWWSYFSFHKTPVNRFLPTGLLSTHQKYQLLCKILPKIAFYK